MLTSDRALGNASARRSTTQRRRKKPKKRYLGVVMALIMLVLVGCFFAALELSRPHVDGDRIVISRYVNLVMGGRVRTAKLLNADAYITGTYTRDDGIIARYNAPMPDSGTVTGVFFAYLRPAGVPTTVDQQTGKKVAQMATAILPGIMIVCLFAYFFLSYRRKSGLFSSESGPKKIEAEDSDIRFSDIAGQDEAVNELKEMRSLLAEPERAAALGASVPRGVLIYGPPGCGKTMLARALAAESGASFYSISGSDFVELYVGVGAARVRELFKEARANSPAIVFIDELDSIGYARGTHATQGEHDQSLNQILAEMDGFSSSDGVFVVAATNRPDILDQALLRPGRFDRTIGLDKPDEAARLAILGVHARGKALGGDVNLATVARRSIGLTGADLANLLNEAALLAARSERTAVTQADLDEALSRTLQAPEKQRRLSMRGRSIGKRFSETDADRVTFADVAGQEEAVEELSEIKDFLVTPERYAAVGAAIPRGVLLYGPPGCGKTMLAKALAAEADAAFISVSASEFVERWVGEGAARLRDLFADAKTMRPAIVFIDELDAVGGPRGGTSHLQSHGEREQTLNQLLTEMDGFSPSDGIIVLGATNRADALDPALLRPGRFDRTIGLALPGEAGRLAILQVHATGKVLDTDVDLFRVASRAIGLTGADLAAVMNEAALLAARARRSSIAQSDMDASLQTLLEAPEKQRRLSLRGRTVGKRAASDGRVTFSDIAGVDDAIDELRDVSEYLADASRYAALGARPPRGILLSGPPGCGKTLLARAVAGEANAAFISVSATEFVEVFVGQGAARVRDLFAEANSMAPAIIFIDEIDAVGARRTGSNHGGARENDQTLNQILVELDGFEVTTALTVLAATNRPDVLDPALVRPGRFDRRVEITLPDRRGRRDILDIYAKMKPLAPDVDLGAIAGLTQGFSGAQLENLMNEGALLASRRNLVEVPMALLEEAVDRARMGLQSKGLLMSDEERRIVAYHEAGHALVASVLPHAKPPHKLTISARGGTLGHSTHIDTHDRLLLSRSMMMEDMATGLGGRVAEEVAFGEFRSGCADDLRAVENIARRMVCQYGMSSLGPSVLSLDGRRYSEETVNEIDTEVRALIDEAIELARSVLAGDGRMVLDRVATALLDRETLAAVELEALAEGKEAAR